MAKRAPRPTNTGEATDSSRRSKPKAAAQAMLPSISETDVRVRAYELYLERGGGDGADFDDWLRAEQELRRTA